MNNEYKQLKHLLSEAALICDNYYQVVENIDLYDALDKIETILQELDDIEDFECIVDDDTELEHYTSLQ
jgi:hypothetical protein